jgi:predicted nucleotidyltransferase
MTFESSLEFLELPGAVGAVVAAATRLPEAEPGIVAVGLAGSWARGVGRADSDVDLVVLTTDPGRLLESTAWFTAFGPDAELIRCRRFGAITERRLRLPDGLVVEVGIGAPSWAATDPVDEGTRRVVHDGFRPVYDPAAMLERLIERVSRKAPEASQ